jgi:hypothetical protein
VDGAVVTVCAAVAALVTAGLGVPAGALATRLLAVVTGVADDGEPHPAVMPMTNTSPQHARTRVSALRTADRGFQCCCPSDIRGPPAETSGKRVMRSPSCGTSRLREWCTLVTVLVSGCA